MPNLFRIVLVSLFIVPLLVCCNYSRTNREAPPSIFDSVMKRYITWIDTNSTMSSDYTSLLLKNYIKKDTAYFIEFNKQLTQWDSLKKLQAANESCIRLEPLTKQAENVTAAYRFSLTDSYSNHHVVVTITNKKDSILLTLLERYATDIDTCISKQKPITIKQWDSLEQKIEYADYWGMQSMEDRSGLDGSTWILEGLARAATLTGRDGTYKTHYVYRWSPYQTAFEAIGIYMLQLAGVHGQATK
jgi:hypothetical protein